MRTLIVLILLILAPAAFAGQAPTLSPDWNRRPPPAWHQQGLAHAARHLDQAAAELYYDIRTRTGRTELSSRARELAEAARDLRRQAERGAPLYQLREAERRVEVRYGRLEQRLENKGREYRHPYAMAGLHEVARALRQTSHAIQRYASERPRGRDDDRWAYDPRQPDRDRDRDWRHERD